MTRTLRQTGLPSILCILLAAILTAPASALTIKLGPVREQTIQWLMESRGLSRPAAEQMIRKFARRNRAEIIDSYTIPDGAIADFVTIDPTKRGREQVKYEGCAMLFSPGSDYGKWLWGEIEKMKGTGNYEYFKKRFGEAVKRGVFIHELTEEQKARLLHAAKGDGRYDQPAAATPIRILIASFRMPPWSDRASSPSYISHGHPIHPPTPTDLASLYTFIAGVPETGMHAGGGWSNGQRVGLNSPAWNETHRGHDDPVNGADSFVYKLRTDFVEHWYTFMFDYTNPNSVANFYRANSHGNVAISGDRGDIAAWLDSHHILDNNDYGLNRDWTPMPGTPIIRAQSGNYISRASVETGQFSVLFRDHRTVTDVNIMSQQLVPAAGSVLSNYRIDLPAGTAPDTPPYTPTAGTSRRDDFDTRHVTFTGVTWSYWDAGASPPQWRTKTVSNDVAFTLRYCPNGYTGNTPNGTEYTYSGTVGQGCPALSNTTLTQSEANTGLLQSNPFNRFMSLCYYTHDHDFTSKGERPHQLSHVKNSRGYVDDIMGTDQSDLNYHVDRPRPYDHDLWDDNNLYTGGYFGQDPGHSTGDWIAACNQVMADWGISSAGYNTTIYIHPAGPAVPAGHRFIPQAPPVVLPEDASLALAGHELGHWFGMGDLYDLDFYTNNTPPPPSPPFFESDAAGPYSIMGNGGVRVDPWHKIALGWLVPTTLETAPGSGVPKDRINASIPEIEGSLQTPIVYKAVPDWATGNLTGGQEYFLIENRNRNYGNYFGDPSPRGLYVWHIDGRFTQEDEVYFKVIIEQADGLYELERNSRGNHGNMESDPFPGSLGIRSFTQFGTVNSSGVKNDAPNTRSHGTPASRGVIVPGSSYDTFFRLNNISDPGANMTADIWVQPHELIVTAKQVAPETAEQGQLNVPVLGLHLKNTSTPPNISTGDVVIREILFDESGSSKRDADTVRALVYEDVNGNGTVEPGTDVLLGTAPVVNQQANITGLSFRVAADSAERDLLLCYDIANNAQPWSTLGAGIDYPEPAISPTFPRSAITCQIPGVIQERERTGIGTWGASRFPIRTDPGAAPPQTYLKTTILEAPDTLTITPTNLAPATAIQGTANVPMLGLRLRVNRDEVILDALKIDSTGTSTRPGDVLAKLYHDQNINGIIDPGDTVLDTATFSMIGGVPTAVFDDLGGYTVVEGTDRGLIVAYDYADDAGDPPAVPPVTVNVRLLDPSYVTLRQTSPPPSAQDEVASTNFDPAPTGMRSTDTLIVVNTPPTLVDHLGGTTDWVIPQDGMPTTLFRWEATYTDAENQPPSPLRVWLDGVAHNMVPVNPGDTNYVDGALFRYETTLPIGNHVYYIVCSDGKNRLRFPTTAPDTFPHPVVTNPAPTLTMATGATDWWSPKQTMPPYDGSPRTTFTWRAVYTDVENEPPNPIQVWIDGVMHPMVPSDPGDTDYTDGAEFYYATTLAVGLHSYYLYASDGTNIVRIPSTAPNTLPGPDVYDPPCTLTDRNGGTTAWLDPTSGTPQTNFVWTAIYTDPESVPPNAIQVWIDGVARNMVQTDPSDLNYADGAEFRYQTTLPVGNHSYYMWADDGNNTVRFPTTPPATYPYPVVTDQPCALVDKNGGTTQWLTPEDGNIKTRFEWLATYSDPENQPPSSIVVNLDGVNRNMVKVNPADNDYRDGALYRLRLFLPVGNHSYFIACSDGNNPLRYPTTGTYPHPVVTDDPCTLVDKNGGTNAWVTPNKGTSKTNFVWLATYTDPENVAPSSIEVVLDGTSQPMTQVDPADQDYTDGAIFTYQTTLAVGTHSFYVSASDGYNTVRYPTTGTYAKPIVADPILTLTDRNGGTTAWLTPTTGTPTTTFTWEVIYTDAKNDPPAPIQIWLDGTGYDMTPVNPADVDYTDGALFRYQTTGLAVATHSYYVYASDGTETVRYPAAPDTYPQPVVNNTAPQLLNAAVNPQAGTETDAFTYTITFRDADGHLPTYVRIKTDNGSWVDMTPSPTEPTPGNTIDGDIYEYTTGFIGTGTHTARFVASDGFDIVYYPASGDFMGPFIQTTSTGFWANVAYNPFAGPYEEGDRVYCVIQDADQNTDRRARDTLDVTITVVTGGDTETVTLLETGPDTGVFRTTNPGQADGVPTSGGPGASGDGVINVAAGPTGNTLRLRYVDPDDPTGNDTLTRLIGVVDTKAPAIVKLAELTAAPDPDGNVVTVDWTAYDETSQFDVARYNVYYASAPAPIATLTPVASPSAGTQTVQINTGGPNGDKYVAVAVYDEVPNVDANVKWRKVSTADTNPPVLVGENPVNGSTEVALDSDISFRIEDPGSGVPQNNIRVRVQQAPADGGGWTDVSAALQFAGTTKAWNITYNPPVDLLYNQHVTVEVRATDLFGNTLTQTFSFDTETDGNAPQLQNAQPANGDVNVPVDTNISFELTDDNSGVDPASIHVTVNGTDVTGALQIGGSAALTTVLYNPPTDFDWGEVVTVTVDASDIAGNAMATVLYTFTILPDTTSIVIDQLTPADRATNVPIDTPIGFRVSDNISGVDVASVELFIDGAPIALTAANFKQLSPTSCLVTYDPPTDFPYGTSVKVRATAKDLAGNPRTGKTWHFLTEPPPTYSITGTIRETVSDGAAATTTVGVPGVKVKIIDFATGQLVKTAISVGTGVFEATGLLDGTYVVEPTLTDYTFVSVKTGKPTQRVYVGLQDKDGDGNPELDASGVDFDATRTLYAIEGRVLEGGQGLQGVTITDGTRTTTTDADGRYRLENVPSGSYTIVPTLTNYTFSPTSRVAVVASANATGIDFTAAARTFSISGTIQDASGNRLSGVKVEVEGGTSVAVTNQAGQYTLTGVKAGQRTIIASRAGYTFEPAPGVTAANLIVDRDFTGVDFIGYPVLTRTLQAGTYFVGVPATPRDDDPTSVFGTTTIARWLATASPAARYLTPTSDPGHEGLKVKPGRGFFVRYPTRTTIQVTGTPVPITEPYGFVIDEGWTMAANPFPAAIGFGNLVPSASNAMAPYGFVLEGNQYVIVSDIAALGGRRWIDAWEGVWLLGDTPALSVTALPPGTSVTAMETETATRVVNRDNWRIPIVAQAAGTTDACCAVGVSAATGALAVPNPPPLDGVVDIVLQGADGRGLAYDLKGRTARELTWTLKVMGAPPNTDVTLSLPDLSEVPEDMTVTLVDVTAGKQVYARTMPSYVYASGQGGVREFRIEVKPRTTTGLTVRTTDVQMRPNLATVSYVVATDAEVTAEIVNISGRLIRTLARNTSVGAGANTLNWDLKSDAQTRVPAGRYLVRIEAVTPDGQRAQALGTILVNR